ncbi:MAG: DUF4489 domain-containing protein [Syntrophomonas sp.]
MSEYSCGCRESLPEHDHENRENKVVLSCGTGSGVPIPVSNNLGWQPCLVVGTVVLDTRGLKKPTVKIDYSSIVNFAANCILFEFEIRFQLSRSCNGGEKVPLASCTYERNIGFNSPSNFAEAREVLGLITIGYQDPVAFTWCDCHDCPGCCTYTVELIGVNAIGIASASITNVGINALAVGC